jgi:cytochrome b involved in lipid metabolism
MAGAHVTAEEVRTARVVEETNKLIDSTSAFGQLPAYSLAQVAEHANVQDAWFACFGVVYDVTDYLEEDIHPGGTILLQEHLGRDISVCSCSYLLPSWG